MTSPTTDHIQAGDRVKSLVWPGWNGTVNRVTHENGRTWVYVQWDKTSFEDEARITQVRKL